MIKRFGITEKEQMTERNARQPCGRGLVPADAAGLRRLELAKLQRRGSATPPCNAASVSSRNCESKSPQLPRFSLARLCICADAANPRAGPASAERYGWLAARATPAPITC